MHENDSALLALLQENKELMIILGKAVSTAKINKAAKMGKL